MFVCVCVCVADAPGPSELVTRGQEEGATTIAQAIGPFSVVGRPVRHSQTACALCVWGVMLVNTSA